MHELTLSHSEMSPDASRQRQLLSEAGTVSYWASLTSWVLVFVDAQEWTVTSGGFP